jgi:hypothetical protein
MMDLQVQLFPKATTDSKTNLVRLEVIMGVDCT